jgi:hypothetical protein
MTRIARAIQKFGRPTVSDIPLAVRSAFAVLGLSEKCRGKRVGITAGSRGITDIVQILSVLSDEVKASGGEPFLLAAMGSHGGGTEEGQKSVLRSLGVTAEAIRAPVVTCVSSVDIGQTYGQNVYILESALSVDLILPVNRIKPHTAFHGPAESGLRKMLAVGLGGPQGAASFHSKGAGELSRTLHSMSEIILEKLNIPAGFAIVENAYEQTALIKGIPAADFTVEEPKILGYAKALMPSLPAEKLDVLIIEEMGKNYSGTGIDTNIIGRLRIEGVPEPASPCIEKIAVLGLSEESHGNANGVGLADVATKDLVECIDRNATNFNCGTTGFLTRGATPVWLDTEREMMELLRRCFGTKNEEDLRLIQISDTLHLEEFLVSEALKDEMENNANVEIVSGFEEMTFDRAGRLSRRLRAK